MARYVDGFIVVVPNDKTEEYKKMAQEGAEAWLRHGALEYYECKGDDLTPQDMGGEKTRAFPEMAGASANETVWFSFIVFESKEHREQVNAAVIKEMSEGEAPESMPFNMTRMAYGGFEALVEARSQS